MPRRGAIHRARVTRCAAAGLQVRGPAASLFGQRPPTPWVRPTASGLPIAGGGCRLLGSAPAVETAATTAQSPPSRTRGSGARCTSRLQPPSRRSSRGIYPPVLRRPRAPAHQSAPAEPAKAGFPRLLQRFQPPVQGRIARRSLRPRRRGRGPLPQRRGRAVDPSLQPQRFLGDAGGAEGLVQVFAALPGGERGDAGVAGVLQGAGDDLQRRVLE